MPTFTLELWRVLDMKPAAIEEDEWIGLHEYELFLPAHRADLNKKIKEHFMYQEIGHETVDQFRFAMRRKMNEIMPTYNQLYRSAALEFDPLSTIDIRTISTGAQEQVSEGTSNNETLSDIEAKAKNVSSNFPQLQLKNDSDYASSGVDSTSKTGTSGTGTENSESTSTAQTESDSRTSGYQGAASELILQFRAQIINVDLMVIAELDTLFMLVWNNGDEYTRTKGRLFY